MASCIPERLVLALVLASISTVVRVKGIPLLPDDIMSLGSPLGYPDCMRDLWVDFIRA